MLQFLSASQLILIPSTTLSSTHAHDTQDAFLPVYRTKLLTQAARMQSARSMTSNSSGARTHTPQASSQTEEPSQASTPTPAFRIRHAGAAAPSRTSHPRRPSLPPTDVDTLAEEEIGGLYDDDVAISRASGIKAVKAQKHQVRLIYEQPFQ